MIMRKRERCNTRTAVGSQGRRSIYFWYDHTFRRTVKWHEHVRRAKHAHHGIRTSRLRCQPVDGVVALAHSTDGAAEREGGHGGQSPAVGIDVDDAKLNGRVVLRGNETVCTTHERECLSA